jgi:hypothetical protein
VNLSDQADWEESIAQFAYGSQEKAMPIYLLYPGINGTVLRKGKKWLELRAYGFSTWGTGKVAFERLRGDASLELFAGDARPSTEPAAVIIEIVDARAAAQVSAAIRLDGVLLYQAPYPTGRNQESETFVCTYMTIEYTAGRIKP